MKMPKPLPCPFCGRPEPMAEVDSFASYAVKCRGYSLDGRYRDGVRLAGCGAKMVRSYPERWDATAEGESVQRATLRAAITAWNRRPW